MTVLSSSSASGAFDSYSALQTELIANSARSDLTARIPAFIQLCEDDMQRRLKLVDFESNTDIVVTAGVGSMPSDFASARAVYWDGDEERPLRYITPDRYNAELTRAGLATYYTVIGSDLLVLPQGDGTAVMTYTARFTPLSDANTSNAILETYPDAYFFGALKWLYHHTRNWEAKAQQSVEFERVVGQIIKDHKERKYTGPLEVRAR